MEKQMSIFIVRMEHPEGTLWNEHVLPHISYLKNLVEQGRLLASGPVKGTRLRAGFLVMRADSREEVQGMIDDDPFAQKGVISALTVEEWDPLFGLLADYSSGQSPADPVQAR
jgi:hypothetical protein